MNQRIYNYTKIFFLFTTLSFFSRSISLLKKKKRERIFFSSLSLPEAAFFLSGKLQTVSSSSSFFLPFPHPVISFFSSRCVFFSPITGEYLGFRKPLLLQFGRISAQLYSDVSTTASFFLTSAFSFSLA